MPKKDTIVISEPELHMLKYGTCFFKNLADNTPGCVDVTETDGEASSNDDAINNKEPILWYSAGHGAPCLHTVECKTDYIIGCGSDQRMDMFKNSVVHLQSCKCGERLGLQLVDNGSTACFAYDANFIAGTRESGQPWPDSCTKPHPDYDVYSFCDSDTEGEREMLFNKGSTGDAKNAMINKFNEYIDKYQTGEWKDWPNADRAIRALKQDRNHLKLFGDANFVPFPCGGPTPPPTSPTPGPSPSPRTVIGCVLPRVSNRTLAPRVQTDELAPRAACLNKMRKNS